MSSSPNCQRLLRAYCVEKLGLARALTWHCGVEVRNLVGLEELLPVEAGRFAVMPVPGLLPWLLALTIAPFFASSGQSLPARIHLAPH